MNTMPTFHPKFITFDCYGTLTNFEIAAITTEIYGPRLKGERLAAFLENFRSYRMDEILGDWKPYSDVIHNAVERTCRKHDVPFEEADARRIYDTVPTWGPHPDVPAGLARIADKIPLVILSNAANEQMMSNVDKLGVPFHRVFTAEDAKAYKPRFRAFEYMFDMLDCGPEDVVHCSSSFRYDLMAAYDLGITQKCWINRGHEPANPFYGYVELKDTGGLAEVVGL